MYQSLSLDFADLTDERVSDAAQLEHECPCDHANAWQSPMQRWMCTCTMNSEHFVTDQN